MSSAHLIRPRRAARRGQTEGKSTASKLMSLIAVMALAGCTTSWGRGAVRADQTVVELNRANFETTVVHAVGQAKRDYMFWIPIGGPPDVGSAAWSRLKANAGIDGQPAQVVNVTEQRTERYVFLPFYYQVVHTVSADAIRFKRK